MRVRIRFTKNDNVKYLGHLDIMRSFQRFFNMADVSMSYSEGYNPHQKMSFALPLGVGVSSSGEYLDAEIKDGQDLSAVRTSLDQVSGSGFDITDVKELSENAQKCMAAVRFASYDVYFRQKAELDTGKYLGRDQVIVEKRTKSGVKQVDVKDLVISLKFEDNTLKIVMKAGSTDNLKPELLCKDLLDFSGVPYERDMIDIKRTELFAEDMVPLIEHQTIRNDRRH